MSSGTKAFQRKNYQENIEKDAASLAASCDEVDSNPYCKVT